LAGVSRRQRFPPLAGPFSKSRFLTLVRIRMQ
jgi:hypothetical protein